MSKDRGKNNARTLEEYFQSATDLPYHGGKPAKATIAEEAGITRDAIHKNSQCVALCAKWFRQLPARIESVDSEKPKEKDRKINKFERNNDNGVAVVHELRRKLRKLEHIEALIEQGKRYIP